MLKFIGDFLKSFDFSRMSESGARYPLPGDGRPAIDGSKKTGEMSEPGVREPQPGDGRPAIDGSKKTVEEMMSEPGVREPQPGDGRPAIDGSVHQLQWEIVESSGIPSWRKDLLPEDENPGSPDCIPPMPTRPNISLLGYMKEFAHKTHQPPKMAINIRKRRLWKIAIWPTLMKSSSIRHPASSELPRKVFLNPRKLGRKKSERML